MIFTLTHDIILVLVETRNIYIMTHAQVNYWKYTKRTQIEYYSIIILYYYSISSIFILIILLQLFWRVAFGRAIVYATTL